jgi:Uncharacterized conserved protein (COG2071)
MQIPVIKGVIKRRLLVNFRADAAVVRRLLPRPFVPKLHRGHAIAGICLIRLEQIRPRGLPAFLGISSENAAHRFAVEWKDEEGVEREGVYIPRRDTDSTLTTLVGGRLFPGEHHAAHFTVLDDGRHIELSMQSRDDATVVRVVGDDSEALPAASCFASLAEASAFFETGSLGYSDTAEGSSLDGLVLTTVGWKVRALAIAEVQSSYFAAEDRFPKGSIEFDHALVMRDLRHEWSAARELAVPEAEPDLAPEILPEPVMARAGGTAP